MAAEFRKIITGIDIGIRKQIEGPDQLLRTAMRPLWAEVSYLKRCTSVAVPAASPPASQGLAAVANGNLRPVRKRGNRTPRPVSYSTVRHRPCYIR